MPNPIATALTDISITYWSQPDSQILARLTVAEQLDAWRQVAVSMQFNEMEGVDMYAFSKDLEKMIKGMGKEPSPAALMLKAEIQVGFRREEAHVELKPEPMLVALSYGGHVVGYARLPDRPGRYEYLDHSSDTLTVQWKSLPLLGAAMMEIFAATGRIEKLSEVLNETMLDFASVGGEFRDGQLTGLGGEVISQAVRADGSGAPLGWVLRRPNGDYVAEAPNRVSENCCHDLEQALDKMMYTAKGVAHEVGYRRGIVAKMTAEPPAPSSI